MKFFALVFLFLACGVGMLPAQTNTATNSVDSLLALVTTNRPAATNQPDPASQPREPLTIKSTGPLIIDMINHWLTYSDNVHVTDGQMKMTCEWLKANFSANGEQPTNVIAETNVVIDYTDPKGQKGRALGNKAVYLFQVKNGATNETLTLTGHLPDNPPEILEGPNYTNCTTASNIVYDLVTRKVRLDSPQGIYWRPTTNSPSASDSQASNNLPLPK